MRPRLRWIVAVFLCYVGPLGSYYIWRYDGAARELKKLENSVDKLERHLFEISAAERHAEAFAEERELLVQELEKIETVFPAEFSDAVVDQLLEAADTQGVSVESVSIIEPEELDAYYATKIALEASGKRDDLGEFLSGAERGAPLKKVVFLAVEYGEDLEARARVEIETYSYSRQPEADDPEDEEQDDQEPPAVALVTTPRAVPGARR